MTSVRSFGRIRALSTPSGKLLTVFAVAADLDITGFCSNTFTLEWPKGSGRLQEFPELDRVAWLPAAEANTKLLKGHRVFLERLAGVEPG